MDYFERVAEPTYEKYSREYRALAAIVVANDGDPRPATEAGAS
jgi:hypothetical protein